MLLDKMDLSLLETAHDPSQLLVSLDMPSSKAVVLSLDLSIKELKNSTNPNDQEILLGLVNLRHALFSAFCIRFGTHMFDVPITEMANLSLVSR